jgi:LysR family glycine cleavage system transcriptional activator
VARLGREVFRETALIVQKARPFAWTHWANEIGLDTPEPRNIIELDTMFSVVRAAERGVGIALVPEILCEAWFRSGALVRLFSLQLETDDSYFLVSRLQDADKPEVTAITDWTLRRPALRKLRPPAPTRQHRTTASQNLRACRHP